MKPNGDTEKWMQSSDISRIKPTGCALELAAWDQEKVKDEFRIK